MTSKLDEQREPLRKLLKKYAEGRFLFVRSGGNWGDELIYLGAENLADSLGLNYATTTAESLDRSLSTPTDLLYLHGGGGYNPGSSGRAYQCLESLLSCEDAIVIQGPCTIASSEALDRIVRALQTAKARECHFFVRERHSYEICESRLSPLANVYLNEDTAFYLSTDDLVDRLDRPKKRYHLAAVREDNEAVGGLRPPKYHEVVVDPAYYASSFEQWLQIHAFASRIVTNRTHSSIFGSIANVPTVLFGGSYHKNRSIWEFSLEPRNVAWTEDLSDIPHPVEVDPALRWIPIRAVRQSWRLNRRINRLRGLP